MAAASGESTEIEATDTDSLAQPLPTTSLPTEMFAPGNAGEAGNPATPDPLFSDTTLSISNGGSVAGNRRLKGKGKGKGKGSSKGAFSGLFPDVNLALFSGPWYEQYRSALSTDVDAEIDGTFCTKYDLIFATSGFVPYQGVGPLGPSLIGVRTAQSGTTAAPFVPVPGAQFQRTFALWQLDIVNSPSKLIESTSPFGTEGINYSTLGAWNIALLGLSKTLDVGYAWAVVTRNDAAFFEEDKPVEWRVLTRDVNKAAFLLLYANDVREAMEGTNCCCVMCTVICKRHVLPAAALTTSLSPSTSTQNRIHFQTNHSEDFGLYDFPDDRFNFPLSTYQATADPDPLGLCVYTTQ